MLVAIPRISYHFCFAALKDSSYFALLKDSNSVSFAVMPDSDKDAAREHKLGRKTTDGGGRGDESKNVSKVREGTKKKRRRVDRPVDRRVGGEVRAHTVH